MFVKLQFTQDKHLSQIFKLITYIVNTPAVTAVSNITAALTDVAVFNSQASVYSGWDPANSYIYRTGTGNNALTTGNTVAKFAKFNTALYGYNFFLEQTVYDHSQHKTLYAINGFSPNLTTPLVYAAHRQSTSGSLIGNFSSEATTTNNLNSIATTNTGFMNANLNTAIQVPVTVTNTTVTTNIVTVSAATAASVNICKGMRFTVTGTTYGGLAANTYTILAVSSANTFTVTAGDYNGLTNNSATVLSTYAGPFTGATYTLEVAAHTDSIWTNASNVTRQLGTTNTIESTVRTAWFYITDNCFLWSIANSTGGTTGLPAGSNLAAIANYVGPFFQAQYTRTDPWNTSANGIIPWIRTNHNKITVGTHLGSKASDFETINNVMASDALVNVAIVADTIVDARPTTTATSWLKYYYQAVNLGAGPRYNDFGGLSTGTLGGGSNPTSTPGTGTSTSYPPLPYSAGTRWWSNDLTKKTYMMLPITWRHGPYNVSGGNITDRTGIYWFNGDYFPGDTLTFNSKTYVLMPLGLYMNDTTRLALAIPRE